MKKNVSFCLLSMLLMMIGLFSNQLSAQVVPEGAPCKCFWLENTDPTIHGTQMNSLQLQKEQGQIDYYRIMIDSCLFDDATKVSLEWEIRHNGQIVDNAFFLKQLVQVELLTKYDPINGDPEEAFLGARAYLPYGKPEVIKGEVRSYPGAIEVFPGLVSNFKPYSLDFFYLKYFSQTDKFMRVNWRQAFDQNFTITLHLVERIGGTDYPTLYYDAEQRDNIGGHSSKRGDIIASFEMKRLEIAREVSAEICFTTPGFSLPGNPIIVNETIDTLIPYMNPICPYIDSVVLLHLVKHDSIGLPNVENNNLAYCQNQIAPALTATISQNTIDGLYIEWQQTDGSWETTAPTPSTATIETYYFYARQAVNNTIYCTGDPIEIVVTIDPRPNTLGLGNQTLTYCQGDVPALLDAIVVADAGNTLEWSINNGATWSETLPVISTEDAGTVTYLVHQVDPVTTCASEPADTITVVVNPVPAVEVEITTADPLCQERSIVFTATNVADVTYTWDGREGINVLDTTFATVGVHEITLVARYDATGCTTTDITTVTILALPDVGGITELATATVCNGGTITLEAPAATGGDVFTYVWSTTEEARTIDVVANVAIAPATIDDYSVIVTSANGCSVQLEAPIQVLPLPEVVITMTDNVTGDTIHSGDILCVGTVVKLEATYTAGATCKWSNDATEDAIYVTIENTGVIAFEYPFSVTATTAGTPACEATASVKLFARPATDFQIISQGTVCDVLPITLQAGTDPSQFVSFEWSGAVSGDLGTNATIVATIVDLYTVVATDEHGCTFTATYNGPHSIELNAAISPNDTVCSGATVEITLSPSVDVAYLTTLDWTDMAKSPIGIGAAITYTTNVNFTNNIISEYVVIHAVYDDGDINCQIWDTVTIAVAPQPDVAITNLVDNTVTFDCILDGTFDITATVLSPLATPDVIFDWTVGTSTGSVSDATGTNTFSYTTTVAGTVAGTVTVSNYYDCATTINFNVTIPDTAMLTIVSNRPDTVCPGTLVTLTVDADGTPTLKWPNENVGDEYEVLVGVEDIIVVVTSTTGCYAPDTITIHSFGHPVQPIIEPENDTICVYDVATLTIANYNPAFGYVWTPDGETTQEVTVTAGTYSVTVTDNHGCKIESANVIVTTYPIPDATFAVVTDHNIVTDTTLCEGTVFNLNALGTGNYTYKFNINGTDVNPADDFVVTAVNSVITLTVTDNATKCSHSETITITSSLLPRIDKSMRTFTSCDALPATIDIHFTPVTAGAVYEYGWGDAVYTHTLTGKLIDTVTTTIANADGCSVEDTIFIINNFRKIELTGSAAKDTLCFAATGTLKVVAVPGATTYTWKSLNGAPALAATANPYEMTVSTDTVGEFMYAVEIITAECTAYDTITIWVNRPTPTFDFQTYVCIGNDIVITPSDLTLSYTWSSVPALTGLDVNADILTVPASVYKTNDSIRFTAISKNLLACTNTNVLLVVVIDTIPNYTINYTASDEVCADETITIEIINNGLYPLTYDWGVIAGNTNTVTISSASTTGGDTTIVFSVANATCTPQFDAVTLTFLPLPTPEIIGDTNECYEAILTPATLVAGHNYTWTMKNSEGADILPSPSTFEVEISTATITVYTSGVLTLTEFNPATGCTAFTSQAVRVSTDPLMDIYYKGNIEFAIEVPANSFFNFQLEVDSFCTPDDTRVDFSYGIYKNGVLIATAKEMATQLMTPGKIMYAFNNKLPVPEFGLSPYQSDYPVGRIPSGEQNLVNQFYFSQSGATTQWIDWFFLRFIHNRPITMSLAFSEAAVGDVFEFRYELNDVTDIPTQVIANVAYEKLDGGYTLKYAGGTVDGGDLHVNRVLAKRSLFVTVTEPLPVAPEPIPTVIPAVASATPEVVVYPNPTAANSEITVSVQGMEGDVQVSMYDGFGKVIKTQNNTITKSNGILKLQIGDMPNGVFFISVRNSEAIVTRKVVISNN